MRKNGIVCLAFVFVLSAMVAPASAQLSPTGTAATQVGDGYGQWIEVTYSRPILRGRRGILASGESYGQAVTAGAPVWRAGADVSTRIRTEADLMFGDNTLSAGEYSLFIELKGPDSWVLIVSNHVPRQPSTGKTTANSGVPTVTILRRTYSACQWCLGLQSLSLWIS